MNTEGVHDLSLDIIPPFSLMKNKFTVKLNIKKNNLVKQLWRLFVT